MSALTPASLERARWFRVDEDEVCLLRDGAQAYPAMLAAIAAAEREVLLEMYWVSPDGVGLSFLDALAERARAGVRVRVIYDAVGSISITPGFWASLVRAGGEIVPFHSVFPIRNTLTLDVLERRDHRKMLVIDSSLGFIGGINLSRQWLPKEEGGDGWRDDMVAVRGEVAHELRALFFDTWRRATLAPSPADLRPVRRRRSRRVFLLANPWRKRRDVRREYLRRIYFAKSRIDIANPYFVPNRSVRGALGHAAERGVRVRVLVPERGDVRIVQFAVEAFFEQLLKRQIEIYAMPNRVMHAKTAIIDDSFATIGSYNLDERSWRKNMEVNLAVEDEAFARHARAWFDEDCKNARRIELDDWRTRPATRRALEWIAYGLRRLW
ncbi:MAG TPA: phospholipase D-like domain-containing protein [Polyangiaceae bacterium]|jgi:cardiolipin synthase